MTTLLPTPYPVDLTGEAPSNLIVGEPHAMVRKATRVIAPTHAPFFKKNLVITDTATSVALTTTQYRVLNIVSLPSAMAGIGNEVYATVAITDEAVSDNVQLTYQTVGGEYTRSYETIRSLIDTLSADTRPSAWPNIVNTPDNFDPSLHFHAVGDVIGWEYVASSLEEIRNVMLLGDELGNDALLRYVDQQLQRLERLIADAAAPASALGGHLVAVDNPHRVTKAQVGLALVKNYPVATQSEAVQGTASDRYMTPSLVAAAAEHRNTGVYTPHITNMENPHGTTKAQVGLALLQNFGVATLAELQLPSEEDPKYVTNLVLKSYLTLFFTAYDTALAATVAAIRATADAALNRATNNTAAITQVRNALTPALASTARALNDATNAGIVAAACNANTLAAETLARNLLTEYTVVASGETAQAVESAQAQGYAEGFNAGDAAGYARGYIEGRTTGHALGMTEGTAAGDTAGYTRGYNAGYAAGYALGVIDGTTSGYNTGYSAGLASTAGAQYVSVVTAQAGAPFTIPLGVRLVDIVASGAAGTAQANGENTIVTLLGFPHIFEGRLLGNPLNETTHTVLLNPDETAEVSYSLPAGGTLSVSYLKNL